jgi:hypothetical protein
MASAVKYWEWLTSPTFRLMGALSMASLGNAAPLL